jgi:signal peptidase I
VLAVLAGGLLGYVIVRPRLVRVSANSMAPTLRSGDYVLVSGDVGTIARGDVIAFRNPSDPSHSHLSRVIALPGERVAIAGGTVRIDGRALDEPYVAPDDHAGQDYEPIVVPEDRYFVMGDNRRNAMDSRVFGPIERRAIWGKRMSW